MPAVNQYQAEKNQETDIQRIYPHPIFENCLPHCDVFLDNAYTKEEMKLVTRNQKNSGVSRYPDNGYCRSGSGRWRALGVG